MLARTVPGTLAKVCCKLIKFLRDYLGLGSQRTNVQTLFMPMSKAVHGEEGDSIALH